jgi:broad specificity phosphatase PhoE
MKEIWLIRHAESEANAGLRTTVPAEVALTPRGFAQSDFLARAVTKTPAFIIVSPYLRAVQTAEPLVKCFPNAPVSTWEIQEFTYLALTNTRNSNSSERRPFTDAFWARNEPDYDDGEGAESFADFWRRSQTMVDKIRHELPDNALIFCHGQLIRAALWQLLSSLEATPDVMSAFYSFLKAVRMPNASYIKILVDQNGTDVFTGEIETAHLPSELITN